ncbi:MAG: hypothetical protein COU68_00790, partial [Candidatus Pacebacteria bacterium CG10_big_fil_rev_8_21_14_0_10_45_6]
AQFAIRTRLIGDFANFSPEEQDEITGLTSKILALFPVGVGVSQEPPRARAENSFTDQTQAVRNAIAATDLDAAWNILQPLIVGRFAVEVSPTERNDVARLAVKIFTANIEQLRQLIADHGISDVVTQAVRALEARVRANRNLFVNPAEAQVLLSTIDELLDQALEEEVVPDVAEDRESSRQRLLQEFNEATEQLRELLNRAEAINKETDELLESDIQAMIDETSRERRILNAPDFERYSGLFESEIKVLERRLANITPLLGEYKDFYRVEQLRYMPIEQLARLSKSRNADPFLFSNIRESNMDPYDKAIALAAQNRLLGSWREGDSPAENRERETWKVWLQYKYMEAKLQNEAEKASSKRRTIVDSKDKTSALEDALNSHVVSRDEVMRVMAHDVRWGNDFKILIAAAIAQAGLRDVPPGHVRSRYPSPADTERRLRDEGIRREPIMTSEGQMVLVDGRIYKYSSAMSYESLADEQSGRAALDRFFRNFIIANAQDSQEVRRHAHPMAIEFANLAYITHSLLDDSFLELQAATKTRAHNAMASEPDTLSINKCLAISPHRVARYARPKDWSQLIFPYFDLENMPSYYFESDDVKHQILHTVHLFEITQKVLFDTDQFFHVLPFPKYLELLFPSVRSLVEMQKGETMWVSASEVSENETDQWLVDHNNNLLAVQDSEGSVWSPNDARNDRGSDFLGRFENPRSLRTTTLNSADEISYGRFILPNRNSVDTSTAKVTFENRSFGVVGKPKGKDLYFIAEKGFERVLELTFGSLPAELSYRDILESFGAGKAGLLNECLSAWGMAKVFPWENLDRLLAPLLGHYLMRLIAAFEKEMPRDRVELVKGIFSQLGRASTYGGLGYENLRLQVDGVLRMLEEDQNHIQPINQFKNVTVTTWGPYGITGDKTINLAPSVNFYENHREKELHQAITEIFVEEHPSKPIPPISTAVGVSIKQGIWRLGEKLKYQPLDKDQEHLIAQAKWEASIAPQIDRNVEIVDKKAGKES